jgi:signal transduction histidine kinase
LVINSDQDLPKNYSNLTRESLGLLFSSQLAELHGGKISIQGSPESGHRYVLSLPLQQ